MGTEWLKSYCDHVADCVLQLTTTSWNHKSIVLYIASQEKIKIRSVASSECILVLHYHKINKS